MATEFTATVASAGGDYTNLSTAEAGLQNDLTAATIKVFSISAKSTPTLVAGDTTLGQTSAATGVCVLVNVAGTQVLIKTIAIAAYQSGEVVQKTADPTVTVTLSNAGAAPIIGIKCSAMQDTTAVTIVGWTTSATSYIRIYAATGAEAKMPYDTSTAYRLELATTANALDIQEEFVRIERIQIKKTSPASATASTAVSTSAGSTSDIRITGCYVLGVMHASNTTQLRGIKLGNNSEKVVVANCVVAGFTNVGNTTNAGIGTVSGAGGTHTIYNCTVYNCATGYLRTAATMNCKNCLYDGGASGNQVGYSGTIGGNNNASTLADAPGTSNRNSQTFTFVSTGTGDYHLGSGDTGATGFAADLSADATYAFAVDFDSVARTGTWDIGATIAAAAGQPTARRFSLCQRAGGHAIGQLRTGRGSLGGFGTIARKAA